MIYAVYEIWALPSSTRYMTGCSYISSLTVKSTEKGFHEASEKAVTRRKNARSHNRPYTVLTKPRCGKFARMDDSYELCAGHAGGAAKEASGTFE